MMEPSYCPANCSVQFLSELSVCTAEKCTAPPIRCKECFWKQHASVDQQGKKKTHTHQKFDESPYYRNFCSLIKVYQIILSKFNKTFGKINQGGEYFANQIFNTSDFIAKIFHSQHALGQFYVLKELYYQRPAHFANSPSADLLMTLAQFTQKQFNHTRSLLVQPGEQQQLLGYYFNFISNTGPQNVQKFISQQQEQFLKYCDQVKQKNGTFDVLDYLSRRRKSQDKDPIYFSLAFENFMQQKYGERPQQQQLFTPSQYTTYVWENLQIIALNKQIQTYLDSWASNYAQYAQFMKAQNLQPTLLAFRMWKNHAPQPDQKTQNKFFLDNFIFAYIDILINNQYSVVPSQAKTWKDFIKYLKDYVALSKLKQQQFVDITKYAPYYEFRHKNQQIINRLQKSQDISFNKQYCIQYLNQTYKDGAKVSIKNYKKLLATKQEENLQKQNKLTKISQNLQKQLEQQEGEKFYVIIFNDYLRECLANNVEPSKQKYQQFKKQVLERVDEEGIKLQNDKVLLQQKQALQGQKKGEKTGEESKQSQAKVEYKIDQAEEQLANMQADGSSEEGQFTDVDCPCCGGKPEDCQKPECQMMGYCVTCSL